MAILGMENNVITCITCKIEITEYYHEGYKGARGKCPRCGVDFPLE